MSASPGGMDRPLSGSVGWVQVSQQACDPSHLFSSDLITIVRVRAVPRGSSVHSYLVNERENGGFGFCCVHPEGKASVACVFPSFCDRRKWPTSRFL